MKLKFWHIIMLFVLQSCVSEHPIEKGIIYPENAEAIIDVTKAPYFLDNTGTKDCSEALIKAVDDIIRPTRERQKYIEELVKKHPDTIIGFEINPNVGVIFPDRLEPSKILYFPNGTYKVSKTIEYTFEDLQNTKGNELCRQIHFQGQSEKNTIFKLIDNAPGFNTGEPKPVISFIKGSRSNIAMSNTFENITIDIGKGNPDAIGLNFFANNTGAVRNVTIKSSDDAGKGKIGLGILKKLVSGSLFKDITIEGFETGIEVRDFGIFTVFEHIKLKGQTKTGFHVIDNVVSIRDLQSENSVPALSLTGEYGHAVIIDSHFKSGSSNTAAMIQSKGFLFARNIKTNGYKQALDSYKGSITRQDIDEYSSHGAYNLFGKKEIQSLNMPIKEVPYPKWPTNMSDWACANDFGAKGDGKTDDTKAIQAAMNSGKKVIYFQPGKYVIDASIEVPAQVERINFMYVDLIAGEHLRKLDMQGAFKITGESEIPLVMEDLLAWEEWVGSHFFIDHASKRALILSDLHTQIGSMYFNSVEGGTVFIENVACTDEDPKKKCFIFNKQKVWAHQINPERANPEIINNGSDLWIMGFKFENKGISIHAINGARTEVLGGVINHYYNLDEKYPCLLVENSKMSFVGANRGNSNRKLNLIIKEIQNDTIRTMHHSEVQSRDGDVFLIPLYRTKE